jgi:hypothetical protein
MRQMAAQEVERCVCGQPQPHCLLLGLCALQST